MSEFPPFYFRLVIGHLGARALRTENSLNKYGVLYAHRSAPNASTYHTYMGRIKYLYAPRGGHGMVRASRSG